MAHISRRISNAASLRSATGEKSAAQRGFTILEVLIVVVVIGILAAIVLAAHNQVTRQAAESVVRSDLTVTSERLLKINDSAGEFPEILGESAAKSKGTTLSYATTGTAFCLDATSSRLTGTYFKVTEKRVVEEGECAPLPASIGAGAEHVILLTSKSKVYAAGYEGGGRLGNGGTTATRNSPVAITSSGSLAGKVVTKVAAGHLHSLAIDSEGSVHAWGAGSRGTLGTGNSSNQATPVNISSNGSLAGKTIVDVAIGLSHSFALASDGTLHAWGWGHDGALGTGNLSDQMLPVNISSNGSLAGKTITSITAGMLHGVALASDGTVHTWGTGEYYRLGYPTNDIQPLPANISSNGSLAGKTIRSISTGREHSLAVATDGSLHAWGQSGAGQLGNGPGAVVYPVNITGRGSLSGKVVRKVSAGGNRSLVLAADGTLHAWGQGGEGGLGTGSMSNTNIPVNISGSGTLAGRTIAHVVSGHSYTFAVATDGTLHAWGFNGSGQLGTGGDEDPQMLPTLISIPSE